MTSLILNKTTIRKLLHITSQYQKIIEEALDQQPEVKLTDIASMIKERQNRN